MGKLSKGIIDGFSGKVGPVIGSSWNGIFYMKSLYKDRTAPPTEKEAANRNKFKMAQLWLKPALPFLREGFKDYSPTIKGFLAAKSLLMRNSFEGTPPDISINPALVKMSHGSLPLPENITMEVKEKELHLFWNNTTPPDGNAKDQVMMIAYDIDASQIKTILQGQFRETGSEKQVFGSNDVKIYHVWIAFVAHDRSRQSDSVYLGEVAI